MLGFLVFTLSFIGFSTVTIIFPILPPGSLLTHFFGSSESNTLIVGMNSNHLLSAIINGFCWALVVTLIFLYLKGPRNQKTELPIWVPGYAKSKNS